MEDQKPKGRTAPAGSGTPNPSKIFIQWKSKKKAFVYYSKEKEEDILLPMPFSFIPLHICQTVKGYNHKKSKTFIANEVENTEKDILTVNSYNKATKERKLEHQGFYKDIKEAFDQNIKYTASVYAAIKNKKGELSLVNLQLNGAGLHHWINFTKKNNIWKGSVIVKKTTQEQNGDVPYQAPVYEIAEITEEDDVKAAELQEVVKEYLKGYYERNNTNAPMAQKPAKEEDKPTTNKDAKSPFKKGADVGQHVTETEEEDDDIHAADGAPDEF